LWWKQESTDQLAGRLASRQLSAVRLSRPVRRACGGSEGAFFALGDTAEVHFLASCIVGLPSKSRIVERYSGWAYSGRTYLGRPYLGRTRQTSRMLRASTNRCAAVRVVCVLTAMLVCAMGVVQAAHAHPENSTTSRHACSICSTAHAGLSTETIAAAPVQVTTALANPAREETGTFRAVAVHFIRPPPAV